MKPLELTCLLCNHSFNWEDIKLFGKGKKHINNIRWIKCPNCNKMI